MALIKCPDCGKMFSEYAECCPECGCPSEDAKAANVGNDVVPHNVDDEKSKEQTPIDKTRLQETVQPATVEDVAEKKKFYFRWLGIIGILAIFVICGVFAYNSLVKKNKTLTSDNQSEGIILDDSLVATPTSDSQSGKNDSLVTGEKSTSYLGDGVIFGIKGEIMSVEYEFDDGFDEVWEFRFDRNNKVTKVLCNNEIDDCVWIKRNSVGQISELGIEGGPGVLLKGFGGSYTYDDKNRVKTCHKDGFYFQNILYTFIYDNNDIPIQASITTTYDECREVDITNPQKFKTKCVYNYSYDEKGNWTKCVISGQEWNISEQHSDILAGYDYCEPPTEYYYHLDSFVKTIKRKIKYRD